MTVYRFDSEYDLATFTAAGHSAWILQREFPVFVRVDDEYRGVCAQVSKKDFGRFARPYVYDSIILPQDEITRHYLSGATVTNGQSLIRMHSLRSYYRYNSHNGDPTIIDGTPRFDSEYWHLPQNDFASTDEILEYLNDGGTIKSPHGFIVELIDGRQQIYGGARSGKNKGYRLRNYWSWRKNEVLSDTERMLAVLERMKPQ